MLHPAQMIPTQLKLFACVLAFFSGLAAAAEKTGAYYGGKPTEYPAWFKDSFLNLKEDIAEAKTHNKRVMIFFTQDNCPYCNVLIERNLAQKEIDTYLRKHFEVIAINMWGDREVVSLENEKLTEKSFATSLKVQYTPTLIFFNEAGKTVLRLNGYLQPAKFKTALEYVAQHKENEMTYRDYLAAHQPAVADGALIQQDFFKPAPYNLSRKGKAAKPVAVFFEQKDCPDCAVLHRQVLPDKETRDTLAKFDVFQLDMWSEMPLITPQGKKTTARQWAKELDVKYAPSILVFNPQGKEIIRSEAFFKVFHTQGLLAYVLSGDYKKEPSFQRYLSARAEHLREQGKDIDIWRMADEPIGPK